MEHYLSPQSQQGPRLALKRGHPAPAMMTMVMMMVMMMMIAMTMVAVVMIMILNLDWLFSEALLHQDSKCTHHPS